MRDLVITILVFAGLIYTLKKPYVGILIWSWLGYMNPHRLAYGFAYTMPFAQITAIITMFTLLTTKDRSSLPITFTTSIWLLFILYMTISTFFAIFPEDAYEQLIKVYKIQIIILLTFFLINSKEKINQLIWVITLSIGFFSIKGGIFTILTGGSHRVWGPPGSYIEGNNELGVAVLMIIPFFFYLRTQVSQKWLKYTLLVFALLSIFTVLGTQSRGAFLALGVMAFFFWLKTNNKIITGTIGSIFIVLAISFMPSTFKDRMNTIETYEEDRSAMGRINAWTVAINISNDHVFGGGFNHWSKETFALYAPIPDDVHDAHSIYFEVLGEHGYLGLFLFLLMWFLTWRNTSWILKKTNNILHLAWCNQLIRMTQVSLLAYFSGGAFLGLAYWDLPYHLLAIIVITKRVVESELNSFTPQVKNDNLDTNDNLNTIEKKRWAWQK